jgi:chemotaxis signal transduction protein
MVIQVDGHSVGLGVQYVNDIEWHDAEQLQPAATGLFPPGLLPFVKGYLPGANGTVLDSEAIARCPMWQVHRT